MRALPGTGRLYAGIVICVLKHAGLRPLGLAMNSTYHSLFYVLLSADRIRCVVHRAVRAHHINHQGWPV